MSKFLRRIERGAVSGYVIGVLALAIILVGGVLILKNGGGKPSVPNQPIAVQSANEQTASTQTAATNTNTTAADEQNTAGTTATTANDNLTATGANSGGTPDSLAQTGPADTLAAVFGLVLIGASLYAAWYYRQSRLAVTRKLLEK